MNVDRQLYCDGPGTDPGTECGRDVAGHGRGKCSTHLKQLQRVGKMTPIAEKLNAEERAVLAGTAMLEADSDEDYARCRRSFLSACAALGGKSAERMEPVARLADELRRRRSAATKSGLASARARGALLGRPPKAPRAEIEKLFGRLQNSKLVAQALEVSVRTVYRALRRSDKNATFLSVGGAGPRTTRGST